MIKAIPIAAVLSMAALIPAGAAVSAPLASGQTTAQLQLPQSEIVQIQHKKRSARRGRAHRRHHYRGRHHRRFARRYHRHHYRHAPRGWHRYHYRPYDWRTRGCIVIGPLWYCP